ncbi:hypothetical protein PR048_031173 [Dryococelus australis]|uniref:Uncharacterized protein n=1 Tax=Dryococelus australis TaxID=614101 RepID=A0ABQ9G7E5_9NEOP|nr:hypothetical protein PR048_031173 [Dryococelus australis]
MPMSTAHWLSSGTVEGEDWVSFLRRCQTPCGPMTSQRRSPIRVWLLNYQPKTQPVVNLPQQTVANQTQGPFPEHHAANQRMGGRKREIPEKTRRSTTLSRTIPTCENPVTRPGIEPGSPWWDASRLTAHPPWPPLYQALTGERHSEIFLSNDAILLARATGFCAAMILSTATALGADFAVRNSKTQKDFSTRAAAIAQQHSGIPTERHSGVTQLVHTMFDTPWRTLAQSSPSTVTPDNQCAVDIGIFVHKNLESSPQVSLYLYTCGYCHGEFKTLHPHPLLKTNSWCLYSCFCITLTLTGATVVKRLACSPTTNAIRMPDDAPGPRVFSGLSRFPRPFIPVLLHTHLDHPHRL